MNHIIVTGGAGFIESAVARHIINDSPDTVSIVDQALYLHLFGENKTKK